MPKKSKGNDMVIGIDLGGMSAKGAILKDGKLLGKSRVTTDASKPAESTACDLAELCMATLAAAGASLSEVEAIGIGSPGVIDSENGTVVYWSNFQWRNVELAKQVEKLTGKKVFVTNDANAAALGEARYGAGKAYENSILVTLGTGVGGGIVLGGKLFEGFKSAGAEIGHMSINFDGGKCTCGRAGCFERYASATALINTTREEMMNNPKSAMWQIAESIEKVDGRTAFDGMRAGDETAKIVINKYISALGEGIVNLVNLFRPQAILVGGGVSAEGEALLQPLREYVFPRVYVSTEYAPFELKRAELGNDAGIFGAAQYAVDRLAK